MFATDRQHHRQTFITAWAKAQAGQPLEPVEAQIVEVVRRHPEYHSLLTEDAQVLERDFLPEQGQSNPFLHLALHIAINDQLTTDQPPGVRRQYADLLKSTGDPHEAEHLIMECLAEAIWTVQRHGTMFDPGAYLTCIKRAGKRWRRRP
jgi:hypothetical protein